LQCPLERPLEVPQRLWPRLPYPRVPVPRRDNVLLPPRLDPRQRQFLAEDGSHLLHRQLHFEDMPARLIARPRTRLPLSRPQRLPRLSRPLPHSSGALIPIAELRDLDLRQGNGDQVLPLLADHLAPADVLRQIALHLAADKLAEALVIAFDFLSHGLL